MGCLPLREPVLDRAALPGSSGILQSTKGLSSYQTHTNLRILVNSVSEKNSSRKLADQARLPTPRYLIGMRVYESGFLRMSPLGNPLSGDSATLCLRMCHLEHKRHQRTRRLTPHGSATQNRGAT